MWRDLLVREGTPYVGVFGIAYDGGASVGKGAALAPSVLRDRSRWLPPYTCRGELIPEGVLDLGDVSGFDAASAEEKLCEALKTGFAIMLGGDHSSSILTESAYRRIKGGRVGLIHVDAHADFCDEYEGSRFSHACPCKRAMDGGYAPEDFSLIGIRSLEAAEVAIVNDPRVTTVFADDYRRMGTEGVLNMLTEKYRHYDSIYLSFDIDALDPGFAPGTGTPESFGLTPVEVRDLITGIIKALPVGMMDLVEISPPLDSGDITVWAGLKILLEVFKCISDKKCNFKGEESC